MERDGQQPMYRDRERAESFGAVAALYDRARPSYPQALIDALLASGSRRVLDVGCGTGIAAALLAARGARCWASNPTSAWPRSPAPRASTSRSGASSNGMRAGAPSSSSPPPSHGTGSSLTTARRRRRACSRTAAGSACSGTRGEPDPAVRARLAAVYAELEPGLRSARRPRGAGAPAPRPRSRRSRSRGCSGPSPSAASRGPRLRHRGLARVPGLAQRPSDAARARRERLLAAVGEEIDDLGGSLAVAYETVLVSARRR